MLKVLDVDGAVRRVQGGWITTGQPWAYDRERYRRVAEARAAEQEAMRRYLAGGSCRMEALRRDLDDPFAEPCGRCDECAGAWYPGDVSDDAVDRARQAIDRPGVDLEARTQWPTGMPTLGVDVKGKIPADEQVGDGRAVARLSDIGWGARLRELVGPGAGDGPVPAAVVDAVVAVLRTWGWMERPVAVAAMPSRTRPELIATLAERIATLGKLQLLGTLAYEHDGPTGAHGGNSAHRLAAVWERVVVPPDVAAAVAPLLGPVLLIDDVADSRWTVTVAGRALRRAGATAVLPLVLAIDG
jgi:ATP-dependent DNA helicase RecQ